MSFLLALDHYCILFTSGLKENGLGVKEGFKSHPLASQRTGVVLPCQTADGSIPSWKRCFAFSLVSRDSESSVR